MSKRPNMPAKVAVLAAAVVGGSPFVPPLSILTLKHEVF